MITFILLAFALALTAIAALLMTTQFLSIFTAAPYVPTSTDRMRKMIEVAGLRAGEHAVDLGSGDGRLVVAAAQAGARAEGWEMNPLLAFWSNSALRGLGLSDRARIHAKSYRGADLRHVDVVFLYVLPAEMARLERWLPAAMRPGSRVVVHAFPFPTWTPERKEGNVYLYRVPST